MNKLPENGLTPSFSNYGSATSVNKPKIAFTAEADRITGGVKYDNVNGGVNGYPNKGMEAAETVDSVVPIETMDQGKFIGKYLGAVLMFCKM